MALSGEFSSYPTSGFGLYCTWSATQSVTGNYSDVTLNVYLKYYSLYVGERPDSTIAINGTSETYTVPAISESSNSSHTKLLKTKTVRVTHNTNGTKTGVALSASWRLSGTYSGVSVGTITASTTINLDSLDRTAPTVSFTSSSITASGFKLSATSSATSDIWQYSVNNGSTWTQFSTTAGTSATATVTGLSPNTSYTVLARARKQSNQVYGTASAATIKTLGGTILNSVSAVTADASSVKISLNTTVYDASYIHTLTIKNGSTEILTISPLAWSAGTANRTVTLTAAERTTLLTAMASMKSFTGTFEVITYGDTQIGSASTLTATVSTTEATSAPTFTNFTFADSYTTTTNITGNNQLFIQGYSKLQVTPGTATAKNNATIASYSATCNGVTVSNTTGAAIELGAVAKSGTVAVVVTVTDSRGYTKSVSKDITVLAYAKPKLSEVSLRRTNDIESEMQLTFKGTFSAITVDGTNKNSMQYIRYRYKLTSATSYGSYVGLLAATTISGTSFSFSNLELCDLDSGSSYDFQLDLRDKLGTLSEAVYQFVVPQGTPLVALRKGKVGINTPNPEEALHVVGNVKASGSVTAGTVSATTVTATTLTGAVAPGNLSSAVTIAKGGTGATTAAAARSNLGAFPSAGGTFTGAVSLLANQYMAGSAFGLNCNNSDIKGCNGIFFCDAADSAGEGIYFYRSASAYDALYANGGTLYFAPNVNLTTFPGTRYSVYHSGSTIPIANGGTGATTAASARTNLGITATSLYSGSLSGTASTTFNYGSYNAYLIIGAPSSGASRVATIIPKAAITTSAVTYQIADESNYKAFKLSYSGTTVTLTMSGGAGLIYAVYGIN